MRHTSRQGQTSLGRQGEIRKVAALELRKRSGADHRGIVGGKPGTREHNSGGQVLARRGLAQAPIAGYAAAHNDGARIHLFAAAAYAAHQLIHNSPLKGCQQVPSALRSNTQPLLCRGTWIPAGQFAAARDFFLHRMRFEPAEHSRLQAAEAEVGRIALHLRVCEAHCSRIAVRRKLVDDRAAWIAKAKQFGDLIERFTRCVIARLSEQPVPRALQNLEQVRVSAAHHQCDGRKLHRMPLGSRFQNNSVNMAFDMVDTDQRQLRRKAQRLRIGDADQQRTDQSGTLRDGDGRKVSEVGAGAAECLADDRHNRAQMFARRQFRYNAAVLAVRVELRSDDGRKDTLAIFHHGGRGFVAGAFNGENPHPGCYSSVRVLVNDFDYELPGELIAQEPLADRAASRMLVLHRSEGRWEDRTFADFPSFLQPGDALVLNNTKVFPSRLYGWRAGGTAKIQVFLVRSLDAQGRLWQALVRPGRKVPLEERIHFSDTLTAEVLERGDHGLRTLRFEGSGDIFAELERCGHTPLPPYIRRDDRPQDRERYNTVYAAVTGSVAAPTAGLHFTPAMLDACREAGAEIGYVTLHVGLGTFAPLRAASVAEVRLHCERYEVNAAALEAIRGARRRIAVGTTTTRTLETVYATGRTEGETDLFIYPGYEFRAVDAMLTNFHLPKSSLIMLVSALAGRELILDAYRHAVKEQYRFFSYGDCMLIL